MIYERRYIQFNDLVFDGYDMISDMDGEVSFKGSSTEYSYGHGSYRPFKRNYLFVAEREVSMTITLKMKKIPCDQRRHYVRMVHEELAKPGKLWSIKNGRLLWAVAAVTEISENFSHSQEKLVYNINFVIPGGIWYKADLRKTFLVPYDVCSLMDCKGYKDLNPCDSEGCNCRQCHEAVSEADCSCCCSDSLCKEMMLCYHLDELGEYYDCEVPYRVVYDCERAEKWSKDKYIGQKMCVDDICDGMIAGLLYSDTEIPTEDVTIVLSGQFQNPWIKINGNTNIIEGNYEGDLILKPNGEIYYRTSDCCEPTSVNATRWKVPDGNRWMWEIKPGNNSVVVHTGLCCGANCIYFMYDSIAM